jgi:hypothetical protein
MRVGMTKFVHGEFGTLEHTEVAGQDNYALDGKPIDREDANRWMASVMRAEDEISRARWDSIQRKSIDSISWWRHPIIRWKLERIYRRYRPILGPS